MADDPGKRGAPDRQPINVHKSYELRYWSEKFGVSKDELRSAVQHVGPMVHNVARHLGKASPGYSVRALQNWRLRGGGPKFIKVSSRSIRYRRRDLIAWAEARLRASSSSGVAA